MKARLKLLCYKLRRVILVILAWALISAILFALLHLSFSDKSGAFENQKMPYTSIIEAKAKDIDKIAVTGEGIKLEIGMADDISKPHGYLYGEGYHKEEIETRISDKTLLISYNPHKDIQCHQCELNKGKEIVMRIILPQDDLRLCAVQGNFKSLTMARLRSDLVEIDNPSGDLKISEVNANRLLLQGYQSNIRLSDSFITKCAVLTETGNVTLRNNKVQQLESMTNEGNLFIYEDQLKGSKRLHSETGDISIISKRLPYSLMIDAQVKGNGDVLMDYKKQLWKKPQIIVNNTHTWIGSVGNNPKHSMDITTKDGHITIIKQGRYTKTDVE